MTGDDDRRLIALDVDGTLIGSSGQIPLVTLNALERIKSRGHILTIVTGRGLPRLRQALGVRGIQLFGTTSLVAVEQGTRLITLDAQREVHHERLGVASMVEFLSGLPVKHIEFVAYHPRRTPLWSCIWTPNTSAVQALRVRMSNADVITSSPEDLYVTVSHDEPSMIVVRALSTAAFSGIEGTWHAGLNATLVAGRETKGHALRH
ncbi:MAG: HAD hydrolase family protein, partial [Chloroflexota bacterium]|nr:HAD hydrolase family protein [Chloroflexota bacterium]